MKFIIKIQVIDLMNTKSVDLNLLKVFHELWETRNVTKAASKLGITQPAASNALARLRLELKDELFVRAPRGIIPTPVAIELAPKVQEALSFFERIYEQSTEAFDSQTAKGLIQIGTTDYFEQIMMVKLLKRLEKQAPNIQIISKPLKFELPKQQLEDGSIDLAIAGFFHEIPGGFYKQNLIKDNMRCLSRKDLFKGKMKLSHYLKYKHLLIAPGGKLTGYVDRELAKLNKERKLVCGLYSFMSPGAIIEQTDYLLTAPGKLCEFLSQYFKVSVHEPPVKTVKLNIDQVWHQRVHKDPMISWVRQQIYDICSNS